MAEQRQLVRHADRRSVQLHHRFIFLALGRLLLAQLDQRREVLGAVAAPFRLCHDFLATVLLLCDFPVETLEALEEGAQLIAAHHVGAWRDRFVHGRVVLFVWIVIVQGIASGFGWWFGIGAQPLHAPVFQRLAGKDMDRPAANMIRLGNDAFRLHAQDQLARLDVAYRKATLHKRGGCLRLVRDQRHSASVEALGVLWLILHLAPSALAFPRG